MKKWIFFLLSLMAMCSACSDDDGTVPPDGNIRTIRIHLPAVETDSAVKALRTMVLCSGNPIYSLVGNEAIGVYPPDKQPCIFQLQGNTSPTDATIANLKEKLLPGATYYAFMPFADSMMVSSQSSVPISYHGQHIDRFLTLHDTIMHLAPYDFLFAKAQVSELAEDALNLSFMRLSALVRVQITLPDADATYKRIVLTAKGEPQTDHRFVMSGMLDLTSLNTGAWSKVEPIKINHVQKDSCMVITLANLRPTEATGMKMFPAFMIYPGDKRYGFDLRLEYEKNGELLSKDYYLNGYVYKANYYYNQVALDPL